MDKSEKFCTECGTKNPRQAKFCNSCGEEFSSTIKQDNAPAISSEGTQTKSNKRKKILIITALLLLALTIHRIGLPNFGSNSSASSNGAPMEDTSSTACDFVTQALSYHDPRNIRKMATAEESEMYKQLMSEAANAFRDQGESYLAQVAGKMVVGFKGIDEYGDYPVLNYCAL